MQIILTVVKGPHQGQTYTFDRHDHFFVGRAKFAHFRLPEKDPHFSRMHFMIEVNPPACRLLDLGSTNGTQVNGQRTLSADLQHGDLIQGGDTVFRVTFRDDVSVAGEPAITRVRQPEAIRTETEPYRSPAAPPPPPPRNVDDPVENGWTAPGYELQQRLGAGGMGVVYQAIRQKDGLPVALKMIQPKVLGRPSEVQRFLREIDILRQIRHSAIVQLLDSGESEGLLFFAMEYVDGVDAKKWVEQRPKPLSIPVAVGIICKVLEGLEFAHSLGFVHRDVKPSNILIQQKEKSLRVKLSDFGLARAYQESKLSGLTITGDVCGTPKFMAPEQILDSRNVQPVSDQYAAAATLYWMLTRQHTHNFGSKIQDVLQNCLLERPVPITHRRHDIPQPLADVIHRALHSEPQSRYASVKAFAEELMVAIAGQ